VGCSLQGALAHTKNGDEVFWKEKFHAANGKTQTYTQGTLFFFLLCSWGGGEKFHAANGKAQAHTKCALFFPFKFRRRGI